MPDEKIKTIDHQYIKVSNLDKIFFPQTDITKKDVIAYYEKIAHFFLPYVKDHLIVMQRFPNGIAQESFYQKQVPHYFPAWINREEIDLKKGEKQTLALIDKRATLVYLADQAVLVFHSWLSSIHAINNPDKIVFDLDPSEVNAGSAKLKDAARKLKKILEEHGLTPFIMTTGSRGYHIVVPIVPEHSFEKVHDFSQYIAHRAAKKYSDHFTVEMSKVERKGKIFIDYLRNSYGQTSVACYSLRAQEGAPIATPIAWQELSITDPQKYTIKNIFRRLSRKKDPWENFLQKAARLHLTFIVFMYVVLCFEKLLLSLF